MLPETGNISGCHVSNSHSQWTTDHAAGSAHAQTARQPLLGLATAGKWMAVVLELKNCRSIGGGGDFRHFGQEIMVAILADIVQAWTVLQEEDYRQDIDRSTRPMYRRNRRSLHWKL